MICIPVLSGGASTASHLLLRTGSGPDDNVYSHGDLLAARARMRRRQALSHKASRPPRIGRAASPFEPVDRVCENQALWRRMEQMETARLNHYGLRPTSRWRFVRQSLARSGFGAVRA